MDKKVILIIMDGWGIGLNPSVSAINSAKTPFIDSAYNKYPHSKLEASGLAVGLPSGQMGNSEVGHMNIGAGRVVYQDLVKLNLAVEKNTLGDNEVLKEGLEYAQKNGKRVHFIGLVSDGGVHSHINHVKGLCTLAKKHGLKDVFVHAFTDGRDCDPKSGKHFLAELENHMTATTGTLASVTGRYYAMDRDKRWERVKLAYNAMVRGEGTATNDFIADMQASYDADVTDEFVMPLVRTDDSGNAIGSIREGDVVLCFNFRTDRGRQITEALTQKDFPEQGMKALKLYYMTMTNYDDTFKNVHVIFNKDNLSKTIGEILEAAGKNQIRIAETEKYPHVTFFFSGGRESEFKGEKRILCQSPKVATYDLQPEMSAKEIQDSIIPELKSGWADFICLNFANADMVGHTGVFSAAVKACETVDKCTEAVVDAALANDYTAIIIADHGNSDIMINDDGSPNTAHTTNLVPCIVASNDFKGKVKDGKLGDLAPTILKMMGIAIPKEMTGDLLI